MAAGFDAGVRLGEVIEQDMIAIPPTGDQREMVAASPAYLAVHGAPAHPRDLVRHRCIGWRPSPDVAPYRWEFEENGLPFDVAVEPQITTNDLRLMMRTAIAGGGITFAPEETLRPFVEAGNSRPCWRISCRRFPASFYIFLSAATWRQSCAH